MTFVTALSLYLIPRSVEQEVTITTRFLDKKGVLVGMVEKTDTVVTWHQLFMVFAAPFSIPSSALDEMVVDLNRATILEAYSDGYFVDIND